jgi:tetratricopeptide (TPR) repeat protein
VTLCETRLGPEHPETALALVRSAQIGVQVGRGPDVLAELERADAILTANPHFYPDALVDLRMTRADVLLRARRPSEALVAIDGAIEALGASKGADDPFRIALGLFRGKILLALGRPQDARAEALAVRERFAGVQGPMARAYAEMPMVLAQSEAELGHPEDARAALAQARTELDGTYDRNTVPGHNYRVRVAEILTAIGDHRDAIALLEDLAAHAPSELPPIEHAQMWLVLASARHGAGDRGAAHTALERARPFVDPDDPEMAADLADVEARLATR